MKRKIGLWTKRIFMSAFVLGLFLVFVVGAFTAWTQMRSGAWRTEVPYRLEVDCADACDIDYSAVHVSTWEGEVRVDRRTGAITLPDGRVLEWATPKATVGP